MKTHSVSQRLLLAAGLCVLVVTAGAATAVVQDTCGPFTDVSAAICPYVLETYYLGITAGISATSYAPDSPMTRGQAAVFVSKSFDQAVERSSRRAALGQWWATTAAQSLGFTQLGSSPGSVVSDGADLWVADRSDGTVSRVRASDGRLLEIWPVAGAGNLLVAMGRVFVAAENGVLSLIDPAQPPGTVETVASDPTLQLRAMAFDGARLWIVNPDSVSFVTPSPTTPWPITTLSGFGNASGIVFDGSNIWVSAGLPGRLMKLDANGNILQTVALEGSPSGLLFDGSNIWVPANFPITSLYVVQASSGSVLARLFNNGLHFPFGAAFDGKRVLVAGIGGISLWNAADLTPIGSLGSGSFPNGLQPNYGVCSDGINFWISLAYTGGGGGGSRTQVVAGGLARY